MIHRHVHFESVIGSRAVSAGRNDTRQRAFLHWGPLLLPLLLLQMVKLLLHVMKMLLLLMMMNRVGR